MKFEANYSISDLENLSGIKAHTLRIWEKRYKLFEPDRTATNIRYYSNDDLKKILNISLLNKNGYKISLIAGMSETEIAEKVGAVNLVRTGNEGLMDSFIIGMIEMNETRFENTFSSCMEKMGFENTIQNVVFPFLIRIGTMWQTGSINPAQEHFISNLIRQKLLVAINEVSGKGVDIPSPCFVLFLPENEWHEFVLLFYHYALRYRGYRTVYLGQSVPLSNLQRVIDSIKPEYLVCIVTNSFSKREIDTFFKYIAHIRGARKILLSGKTILESKKKLPANCNRFRNLNDITRLVKGQI